MCLTAVGRRLTVMEAALVALQNGWSRIGRAAVLDDQLQPGIVLIQYAPERWFQEPPLVERRCHDGKDGWIAWKRNALIPGGKSEGAGRILVEHSQTRREQRGQALPDGTRPAAHGAGRALRRHGFASRTGRSCRPAGRAGLLRRDSPTKCAP